MNIKSYVTDIKRQQFWSESVDFDCNTENACRIINIYPEIEYQEHKGFGGAFTESSAYNLSLLCSEEAASVIESYFGAEGLRYNIGRTHINSCDFSLGNYTYDEDEADESLESFTIEHDKKLIIPMLKAADKATGNKLKLLASPWSPPAYMKTNGDMNHGGELKEEYAGRWAGYIVRYIKEYEKAGVRISMLTVQNEPQAVQTWDSCIYSTGQEAGFIRDHLGPALEHAGLEDVKVLIWDHNKELVYERTRDLLADKEAAKYIAGTAFHWYTGDHFEAVALVREKYPDKELYFTEGCVEFSRFADSDEIYKAEMYAHDILGNLNAGTNGVIDWNLLLDAAGGPNHVGNFCAAPMMLDEAAKTAVKRLSYYYIGQFSRYIEPGAVRVAVTRYTDKLEVTAYKNPSGNITAVFLNRNDSDIPACIRTTGGVINIDVSAHSIITLLIDR